MSEENLPIKSAAILYKGKRVGLMQTVKYSLASNDGQEQTDSGTHYTDGRTTGKITCGTIVPVPGLSLSIVDDALSHKTVDIALALIDGKIHQHKCRNSTLDFDSDVASGKLTGQFEWMCGKPKIT